MEKHQLKPKSGPEKILRVKVLKDNEKDGERLVIMKAKASKLQL